QHVHTIEQIVISVSLATGLAVEAVWVRLHRPIIRGAFVLMLAGAGVLALSDRTVATYGNVLKQTDYSLREGGAGAMAEVLPADSVVLIDLQGSDSSVEYFLHRPYLRRPDLSIRDVPSYLHPYLLTSRWFSPDSQKAALRQYRVVTAISDL